MPADVGLPGNRAAAPGKAGMAVAIGIHDDLAPMALRRSHPARIPGRTSGQDAYCNGGVSATLSAKAAKSGHGMQRSRE
jgi:hypothetical protein